MIGVTAIFASDKVDEGDIIMQRQITIDDDMYIDQIIEAQALLCAKMLSEIIDLLYAADYRLRLRTMTMQHIVYGGIQRIAVLIGIVPV